MGEPRAQGAMQRLVVAVVAGAGEQRTREVYRRTGVSVGCDSEGGWMFE